MTRQRCSTGGDTIREFITPGGHGCGKRIGHTACLGAIPTVTTAAINAKKASATDDLCERRGGDGSDAGDEVCDQLAGQAAGHEQQPGTAVGVGLLALGVGRHRRKIA